MNSIIPSEHEEHMALMKWIYLQPKLRDTVIHVPNEGKRSFIAGARLKNMGMRKGVSDFFFPIPSYGFHGLWIELKRTIGAKVSPEQKEWIYKMKMLGYQAHVAYGWVEAKKYIEAYLGKSKTS